MMFAAPLCLLATTIALAQTAPDATERYQPVADPAAVVTVGNARFTVLTPQMIRMEWAGDKQFEDHASFAFLNRRLPVPAFHRSIEGQGDGRTLTLQTDDLTLTYRGTAKFSADNLAVTLHLPGKNVTWHPGDKDSGNLMGTARTLDNVNGSNVPLEPGLVSRDGWTLVDDTTRPLFDSADFSMAKGLASPWPWVQARPAGDRLDWYFFGYGHEYSKALGDFVRVAGRIPLPPRYAFGAWWSRYWAYSDQELRDIVAGYRTRNIPLDVLVIDMDWHLTFSGHEQDASGHEKGWSGYTWNRNLFPDPTLFLGDMHDLGLKATLNLHPASGVQPWEQSYEAMARAMGQNPAEKKYVPFQITDRRFVENYFGILHHPLEKQGIDFWWLDWQQESKTSVEGVNPTFWLNYLHFTDQEREGKRPLLFHRWGGLGNHRYQIGFSGDTRSSWESLAFQPSFTATAANVGYAYWSHDIGGHVPGAVAPELYTRWLQFGAFSPILRTHTTKNPDAERRVWAYPEPYSDVMADAIRERYAWIPYIYTEAHRTYESGVAFLRPLYYSWPEDEAAYHASNEYLFGDHLIVAPVAHPLDAQTGVATEDIWLPKGDWLELSSGTHLQGPQKASRSFGLAQTPVYAAPGTIIPKQPPMLNVGEKPVDPLIVEVTPLEDQGRSDYALYEDSSKGRDYMAGQSATTAIHASRDRSTVTIRIDGANGSYPGMLTQRAYQLELPADWPPAQVTVNGKPLAYTRKSDGPGWSFVGNTLTTVIRTGSLPVRSKLEIVIRRDAAVVSQGDLLQGFAGRMALLRDAYAQLNGYRPLDEVTAVMQTGDRLGYHPEQALEELKGLRSHIDAARTTLDTAAAEQARADDEAVARSSPDRHAAAEKHRDEGRTRYVRAKADLAAASLP